MLKLILTALVVLSSQSIFAANGKSITVCQLAQSNQSVEIIKLKGEKYVATFTSNQNISQDMPILEVQKFTREQVAKDPDLRNLLAATGLKLYNFISAKSFITENGEIGNAGHITFIGSRGMIVGQVFFAAYAGYLEGCKR